MGDSRVACCLQGGGVYVFSGTVTITSSSIYGNAAKGVRAYIYHFPSPQCETHVLLVVCREAVSIPFMAQSRLRLPRSVGIELKMCALMFRSSHRPDGEMADISYLDSRLHNCGRCSGQLQHDVRASE